MSLVEFASSVAKRYLNDQRVDALRAVYLEGRNRLAPALRFVHGTFTAEDLRAHLEQRIGRDFEILMVHGSVNGMRPMFSGSPLELVRMLVDYCGSTRTLAMPAFCFGDDGHGVADTFIKSPRFDLTRTPSQMGLASELFRRMPGVVHSRHPVYRISALGPLAAALASGHENATSPAGIGSPFEFMAARETCVLGIGKPVQVLTQVHHADELMRDAFPVPSREGRPLQMTLIERGREFPFELRSRSVDGKINVWRLRQILSPGTLQEWSFHHVPMFSVRAGEVTRQLVKAAERGVTLYEPHGS